MSLPITMCKSFKQTVLKTIALGAICSLIFLTSCERKEEKDMRAELNLEESSFHKLKGWENDNHYKAFTAFINSCERILKRRKTGSFESGDARFGTWEMWQNICRAAEEAKILSDIDARLFFETYFKPYKAFSDNDDEGLFTGYYVASLKGASEKSGKYQYPIYAKPDDLVMVDLGLFREDLKGRRIAGSIKDGRLYPYADRTEIEEKGVESDVLLWADNIVDVFFLHIQGSGRVYMDDGSTKFIGYAGQNGHPYRAIGKFLIDSGAIAREDMSMQAIREWLNNNPSEQENLLNKNPSYVFFRELNQNGAIGGQGVVLTPERSLAVDHSYYPYGMPFWLEAEGAESSHDPLSKLMIGQDTGGAIRGPVRGDVFWGYGAEAERLAGPMKSRGKFWVLLPLELSN